mmetsp:Transcript_72587/g.125996  ORF Transcript_72587/g.125996 Transcript_72587/m.125996 type:complete len:115 (-) Transcript_72587:143-487(-)
MSAQPIPAAVVSASAQVDFRSPPRKARSERLKAIFGVEGEPMAPARPQWGTFLRDRYECELRACELLERVGRTREDNNAGALALFPLCVLRRTCQFLVPIQLILELQRGPLRDQ